MQRSAPQHFCGTYRQTEEAGNQKQNYNKSDTEECRCKASCILNNDLLTIHVKTQDVEKSSF